MLKSSRMSFWDLISACRSLRYLSIWRDLTFKMFHQVRTLFMKRAVIFLFQTEWEVHYKFFLNTQRQVESRCLSIGFGAMEISFKSERLTIFSDSKRYNSLRYAHFATRLTPWSSKISSPVPSVSHKLRLFFNKHNQKANDFYFQLTNVFQKA